MMYLKNALLSKYIDNTSESHVVQASPPHSVIIKYTVVVQASPPPPLQISAYRLYIVSSHSGENITFLRVAGHFVKIGDSPGLYYS